MVLRLENTIPSNIEIDIKQEKIIYKESSSRTVIPKNTLNNFEKATKNVFSSNLIEVQPKFTSNVPIYELKIQSKTDRNFQCPYLNPPRQTYGKGYTHVQSKASAIMEGVERYCAQKFPHSKIVRAKFDEISKKYVLPWQRFKFPDELPPRCWTCNLINEACYYNVYDHCNEWVWGYSLINEKPVLVPAPLVFYPYLDVDNRSFIFNDTSGLSCGNTIEEAILGGLAEIVERDSLYNAFKQKDHENLYLIDLRETKNEYLKSFFAESIPPEKIFAFYIKNEKFNPEITTITAFSTEKRRFRDVTSLKHHFNGGSGTHLDSRVAVLRALTEMVQHKIRKNVFERTENSNLLSVDYSRNRKKVIKLKNLPNFSTENIKKNIEHYLRLFRKNGYETIVVKLTHPKIRLPVVRIIVPRLIEYSYPTETSVLEDLIEKFRDKRTLLSQLKKGLQISS